MTKYRLSKQDCSPLIDEWNLLAINMELKAKIATWEGSNKKEGKCRKILKDEREVETGLMKNYMRERYLWSWVHSASATLI